MRPVFVFPLVPLLTLTISTELSAQGQQPRPTPTIEEKTASMTRLDGFFPLYWDEGAGQLWMEIARLNIQVLYSTGFGSGLGSNDIGIDRGALAGSRIVFFERVGPKVLLVQPNYRYRATSTNVAEVSAVRDAFARSVLYGFVVGARTGERVLVDLTEFLVRDTHNLAQRLRPGSYRFESSRSAIFLPMTMNFPLNTEVEVELTFALQPGAGGGGPNGPFEGVNDVAATDEAASVRVHHSWVQLPDAAYVPRPYDARSGFGAMSFEDYAARLEEPKTRRFIRRHRLEKANPAAAVSDPLEPIVYYLDPGVPEPVRSALLDGARWWAEAFEAAGFRNAFRVELLPDGVSPLDLRYNVINWVHRSTRGWSTGGSVSDPRTGEIIKGVVELGSLRGRQDYLIAEGLIAPYETGEEEAPQLTEWVLARLRQLAAHEVGHTLGLGHNYYDSSAGRISVMDYPHPLVTLGPNGTLDTSSVYAVGVGEWDKVAIRYGYSQFAAGTNESAALTRILDEAWQRDLRFMTNQDLGANPRVDQWANGTDPAAELNRMLDVRQRALARFGANAIRSGQPMALLEEVLVPLYLHHRYQVEAAASALGGQHYIYAFRGDGRPPFRRVPGDEQRAALAALMNTLKPSELALPRAVLDTIPPRPSGYEAHRELFPRFTGSVFDAITPATVAAGLTIRQILDDERAARLVEQHAIDSSLPGLDEILEALVQATFGAAVANSYEAEVKRAVERVLVEHLITLATRARMPQVRAIATARLQERSNALDRIQPDADGAAAAHARLLVADIGRYLYRPYLESARVEAPDAPLGAPIGEPARDWPF